MISVIMLTYNRKSDVSHMIEDIMGQTYSDYEYVIVDNGSTDGTTELLKKYAVMDQRIKIITIPVSSIGKARNIGLAKATGDYVAFVDDDDRAKPDFLEFLLDLVLENNADISMCGATEGDGITVKPQCIFEEKYILSGMEAVKMLIGRRYIRNGTPTKLYRRTILERFPFVENYRNEDLHTQYKYFLAANKVVIHGVDKYYFTRHEGNVSGFTSDASKWDARTIRDYLEAYRGRTEYIKEYAPSIYKLAKYSEWSLMISMVDKINRHNLAGCESVYTDIISELTNNKDEFLLMPELQPFEREWIKMYVI